MFRRYLAVLALVCSFSAALPAAETPPRPSVHITVNSLTELLEKADKFAVAATSGRESNIPPGTIPMLAAFGMPVSLDSFESDGQVRILLFSDMGAVFVVGVDDFDAFIEEFSETVNLEEDEDHGTGFSALYLGGNLAVADLGDGRAAAFTSQRLAYMVNDLSWLPDEDGDALATFELPTDSPEFTNGLSELTPERLAAVRDELIAMLLKIRVKRTVAENAADLLVDNLPVLGRELTRLDRARLLFDFEDDGEGLLFGVVLRGAEGSVFARMAEALEENGDVEIQLFDGLPAGAVSAAVIAPAAAVLPFDDAESLYSAVFERLYPELADDVLRLLEESYEGLQESSVAGSYVSSDGRNFSLAVYFPEDAEEMLTTVRESFDLINRVIEATFEDDGYRFRLVGGPLEGVEGFEEYRIEFPDLSRMESMLGVMNDEHDLGVSLAMLQDFRIAVGVRGGALVAFSGQVRPEDMQMLLDAIEHGDSSYRDNPRVEEMLERIGDAQGGVFLLNAGAVMPHIARRLAVTGRKLAVAEGMPEDGYERILRMVESEFVGGGEIMGLSFGAEDGEAALLGSVPAAAVNVILADYEVFNRARRELMDEEEGDGEGDDGEDVEGDGDI